jgi:hypothetical protein
MPPSSSEEKTDSESHEKCSNSNGNSTISIQEHLTEEIGASFLDPDLDVSDRLEKARKLAPFLEEIDGYWSFSSGDGSDDDDDDDEDSNVNVNVNANANVMNNFHARSHSKTEGRLPVLDWNSQFRKSYTLLLWVRPRIRRKQQETTVAEDTHQRERGNKRRLLYRFGDSEDDATCTTGVAVSVGEWRAIEDEDCNEDKDQDENDGSSNGSKNKNDNDNNNSSNHPKPPKKKHNHHRKLIATLTAYSLPYEPPPDNPMEAEDYDPVPFVTAPVELIENKWSMIGITHVFPYLKRPKWSICVNGKTMAGGELDYPQAGNNSGGGSGHFGIRNNNNNYNNDNTIQHHHHHHHSPSGVLAFNTLFREVVDGGCELISTRANDCQKKASELQQNALGGNPRHHLNLHLASFLLASEAFSPTIQALLAQAGPTMSLQASGGVPQLPPVANWSKGSSLEGPNVGIPLVVHGQGLRVQQLSGSCVLWGCATESNMLYSGVISSGSGKRTSTSSHQAQQEIICRMSLPKGTTHNAPRVGLIQPTPTQQEAVRSFAGSFEDGFDGSSDPISLTIVGSKCSIHHNLSNYLNATEQESNNSDSSNSSSNIDTHELFESTTKLFSILALQGLSLDCTTTLPFFLALPPPGTKLDLQLGALTNSLRHLFALYSNEAKYASELLQLLTQSIRIGGGRWHEELLQNGTIHVLVSSLRQSLVRAEYLGVRNFTNYGEFVKARAGDNESSMTATMDQLAVGPSKIPRTIVASMVDLLDACCGPPSHYVEDLDPSLQIQRTSDLALTAVFGMALDWDLWGSDVSAIADIMEALSHRYGGNCVTSGYILRSQISVQYFLDTLRYKLQNKKPFTPHQEPNSNEEECLRRIGRAAGDILMSMLLSSLSNMRSISQSEHDISACMGALSESALGSLCAHVIFRALVGILEWCEIVPPEFVENPTAPSSGSSYTTSSQHCQVSSRLARNLMMAQFNDVLAPMLLSRTVFSAERTYTSSSDNKKRGDHSSYNHNFSNNNSHSNRDTSTHSLRSTRSMKSVASLVVGGGGNVEESHLPLSWQEDWRLGLMVFAWISSIAGPDGISSSRSLASLLLASGLAGSLQGVLEHAGRSYVLNMFMPDPRMAMTVASTLRNDSWSYTDLLSDRLAIMMPIFPSMVISLLQAPTVSFPTDPTTIIIEETNSLATPSEQSLRVLTELITALGGSFYRLFGAGWNNNSRNKPVDDSSDTKTAKAYVPHLLVATMMLEHDIIKLKDNEESTPEDESSSAVTILKAPTMVQKGADDGTWVEVSSATHDSYLTESSVSMPEVGIQGAQSNKIVMLVLESCQRSVLTTVTELMYNAMKSGGGESSTLLWRSILGTLNEVECYKLGDTNSKSSSASKEEEYDPVTKNVLCRILAMVLMKCLKRDYQYELWTSPLSLGISRLCLLVEEKELLRFPLSKVDRSYTDDQVLLLCALLHVLKYGRDTMGWCQLILPVPPGSEDDTPDSCEARGADSPVAAAKVMLPVLQPSLRVVLECIGNVNSNTYIVIEQNAIGTKKREQETTETEKQVGLLEYVIEELRHSLMAAVVGLAFSTARDIALHAMAILRNSIHAYNASQDENAVDLCTSLICMTAEEIRVRYDGERRRRETALIDAYADQDDLQKVDSIEDMNAVEKLILGAGIIPHTKEKLILGNGIISDTTYATDDEEIHRDSEEEIAFGASPKIHEDGVPADFLLLNQGLTPGGTSAFKAKMAWSKYEGLSAALETCSEEDGKPIDHESSVLKASAETVLATLSPFLDAWDEYVAFDVVDTELVKLFDFTLNGDSDDDSIKDGGVPELDVFRLRGSESAADAMTTFIELAAAEKSRTMEVTGIFLPNHRSSCAAFTERFCWSRYMELLKKGQVDDLWERGTADGNRDVRSRLISLPCPPQFRRFIPKYLDHSSDSRGESRTTTSSDNTPNDASETMDIDAFTKLLIKSGQLEIIDITKKEINEEEKPALEIPNTDTLDDDFEEKPLDIAESCSRDDVGKEIEKPDAENATDEAEPSGLFNNGGEPNEDFDKTQIGSVNFNITASAFASPPDNSSSTLGLMHSAAAGLIERHLDDCLHVKTEGSRKCSMLLTSTHLILEYDMDSEGLYEGELLAVREEAERTRMAEESKSGSALDGEKIQEEMERRNKMLSSMRPKSIRWNLSELSHVYLRRYRLRDSSIELFFIPSGGTSFGGYGLYSPSTSMFLDFGPGYEGNSRRDDAAFAIMKRAPPQAIKQWPDRDAQFLHEQLSRLTIGWVEGRITNFDYLLHLNMLAGRSYNDTCQYPIMPWVLSNYHSEEIPDLANPENFRDLTKPMGALNPSRLKDFIERFNTFADPSIPPFMYGSHYSTNAGVVLHFLVRLHPFAGLHRQLQGGHFDVADRLFASVPRSWEMCTGSSAAEVKELTPEWYCNPSFLKNGNKFKLGTSQDGEVIEDVVLPPWAKGSAETFVEVMRNALESDVCSAMLPDWIDLIFGRKQQGPEAIAAHNVFFYLTYYGSVDVAAIEDEGLRQATELQIAHFGQCPMQLFVRPHVRRVQYVNKKRLSFYQITSAYTFGIQSRKNNGNGEEVIPQSNNFDQHIIFGPPLYLPFFSAPLSHWVHLDAPPPGPHSPLISVRLAGTDRCLAVDAQGVFHCFRWAWKSKESTEIHGFGPSRDTTFPLDNGCFIAQRELPRFKTVPRLVHKPQQDTIPAVAISKTLFAGRSILLVLSDGDGRGGLALQLVDPAKGVVRGEAVLRSIHSSRIQCIATDPIGTAAGHGGVGGELAIVGSHDGTASIWRFMSSHYLPLRPRVRLSGHSSSPIYAVGMNASINVAVTVSRHRLCIHSIGNGNVIRIIEPPKDALGLPDDIETTTTFAESSAVAISVQGFVVAICETRIKTKSTRSIITLHLFSMEGVSLGSKALESWRGIPSKITPTPDGTTILVCSGRGVTIHRLSAVTPLEYIDEWQITESDDVLSSSKPHEVSRAFDLDLGPSLNRPVIAAAACSNGVLRLHALPGISAFSDRHKKNGITQSVGSLLGAPARGIKGVFGKASAIGTKAAGMGKDLSKELLSSTSPVKEHSGRGARVTGFIGGMFGKKR